MSVDAHCRRDPLTVGREEPVREVARQMEAADTGCAVIVDEGRRPLGVLTDRDIVIRVLRRGLDPTTTTAGEVMSDDVVTLRERSPLNSAIRRMRADEVRRLPVVDDEGALVGLFDWNDAVGIVSTELYHAARVARPQRGA